MSAFQDVANKFARLRGEFEAGRLSAEQFKEAVEANAIEHDGAWWMIGVRSGKWYRYDGASWTEAHPPVQGIPQTQTAADPDRNVGKGIMHLVFTLVFAVLLGRDFGAYAPEGRLVGEVLLGASAAMAAAAAFGAHELKPQSARNLTRAIFASGLLLYVTHIST